MNVLFLNASKIDPYFKAVIVAIGIDLRRPALWVLEAGKVKTIQIGGNIAGATDNASETNLSRHGQSVEEIRRNFNAREAH